MIFTTGTLARRFGKSREGVLYDLRRAGIIPMRDSSGRRLLTEHDVERLEALQKRPRRLQAPARR